jgi:hypothetical protein
VWRCLKTLKIELPYDSAMPFLSIFLKASKFVYNRGTSTHIFIAALFTRAR